MNTSTETLRSTETRPSTNGVRSVEAIHRGSPFHWVGDGFRVSSFFPTRALPAERVSPFLLMDYHPAHEYPALAQGQRGVGWHPHRGFETVTLAWQGSVAHRDTAGHAGVIGPGDVQWMTAASGVLHEEYHERDFSRRGGVFQMMQLWVNLPAKDKMTAPDYQGITAADIPVVTRDGASVRVVAGEFEGAHGPARTHSPVTMLDVRMEAGATLSLPLPAGHNALVLVAEGSVASGGRKADVRELMLFANDGERAVVTAESAAHFVVLAGEALNEPVVAYGPFVMNTDREIVQAMQDFNAGKFGRIPE